MRMLHTVSLKVKSLQTTVASRHLLPQNSERNSDKETIKGALFSEWNRALTGSARGASPRFTLHTMINSDAANHVSVNTPTGAPQTGL